MDQEFYSMCGQKKIFQWFLHKHQVTLLLTSGDPSQEKYVRVEAGLDRDGLPHVGYRVSKDMPLYVTKDEVTHKHMVHKVSVITVHLSVITVHCFRPVVLCNERID